MTSLSLCARNELAADTELKALLGRSVSWDTWIFDDKPYVNIESTSRCLVVVSVGDQWTSPNGHNTLRFPQLVVDVWADPTRNPDKSIKLDDAKSKIEDIQPHLDRHFHLVDPATPDGLPYVWGSAAQRAAGKAVVIASCQRASGPAYSPVRDAEGTWMGRFIYNVNLL